MASKKEVPKAHRETIQKSLAALGAHPFGGYLSGETAIVADPDRFGRDGFARIMITQDKYVTSSQIAGPPRRLHRFCIELNGMRRATVEEWMNVIAQARLHIALNHCRPERRDPAWIAACEIEAMDLLRHLSIGQRPAELPWCEVALPGQDLDQMANAIASGGAATLAMFSGFGCQSAFKSDPRSAWNVDPLFVTRWV